MKSKFPTLEKIIAGDQGVSEYDKALILGNRLKVNSAIQELDFALRNLNAVDSEALLAKVQLLDQALKLMKEYNASMVDQGIS